MKPNFRAPQHFMVSEVSLGLNQCRINFGTGLECIEPARLLITARKPYLPNYRPKLKTALASPKMLQMTSNFQNKYVFERPFEIRGPFFIFSDKMIHQVAL